MSKFKELNAINVNKMTEKKGNQSYLSWAYAWQETMKICPDMTRKVYESETGNNYHTDGKTAWVKVGITIELEIGDENWVKVMNYVNANKKKGSKFILEQLSKKYNVTDVIRTEVNKEVAS